MRTLFRKELDRFFSTSKAFRELRTAFERPEARISVSGPRGAFLPLLIGELHGRRKAVSLVVTPTEREAENVQQDLAGYTDVGVELFPWWGTAAYDGASPSASLFGDRVHVLSRLLAGDPLLVVAPLRAFLAPVPDPAYFRGQRLAVERGTAFDPQWTARRLAEMGYLRVPHVSIRGEFAVRGEVVDVFVPGHDRAVRITLDFDQVGDIRWFDPLDQSSTGSIPRIDIPPAREVVFTPELLSTLKAGLVSQGFAEGEVTELVDAIAADPERDGVEAFYPLCFPEAHSLLEYLGKDATVFLLDGDRLSANADSLRKEHLELYRRARAQKRLVPMPQRLLLDYAGLAGTPARQVDFTTLPPAPAASGAGGGPASVAAGGRTHIAIPCDEARSFFGNFTFLREEIETAIASGYKIFIFAVYDVQAERLQHILKDLDVSILPLSISAGFTLPEAKLMAIQEGEIFGRKRRIPRSVASAPSTAIESFVELEPGDFVVHVNHGIGVFLGIERISAAGNERDYIEIEYAEGEKLYLPLEQVNLVQRYIGQEGRRPKLDTLGGRSWQRRKDKAKAAVEDLAGSLLDLYSRRKASQGFAFPPDTDWQSEFEAAFPYEETEDQLRCIEEVKRDMEAPTVMDRLVCGDVGYGKTEIALRAAFKAVAGGRQVALLAPTTILTEQHYETFKERFARFPVRIEMLSRFREPREVKKVVAAAAEGSVDILIGTHRLIQKDVAFRNLGLLVVDEEQRFGVKHKERLKHLKANVDCLTLTATPIPRTLNMALMKIRDMSVLNTAPANRLPIETFVSEFDGEVAARAIRAEIARGGQVFWLHNRVETIPEIHAFLQRIVPEASVAVGHGQLDEEELEEVMRQFVHGERQVLLSTTIIENGLDIPNVNTIIMDRADMLGVAQLYQLRGRVGRAGVPAYAYLFYPDRRALSEIAMKRLRIISDHTELGSGFKIALKDLEIRGAGNILGREQHGQILSVGFDLYLRLLDDAVARLSNEKREETPEPYLELEYSGFIPDSYIAEPMEKMDVYKRIASVTTDADLDRVHREIEDRFGPPPDEVASVLALAEIRVLCRRLSITSVKEQAGSLAVEFSKLSKVSVDRVLRLVRESGGRVYLDAKRPTCIMLKTGSIGLREKSEFIRDRISALMA
jgi:transcription-repair coupling factor (superfamily II helicase)